MTQADVACEHINLTDHNFDGDTVYAECKDCDISLWTQLASVYGENASGEMWIPIEE